MIQHPGIRGLMRAPGAPSMRSGLPSPASPTTPPVVTERLTPRFRLRAFHDGDLARMVEAIDDWAVSQWLDTPPYPYRAENGRAWIAAVGADHAGGLPRHFAVAERDGDRLLGCISLEGEDPIAGRT